jgi:PhnB protein
MEFYKSIFGGELTMRTFADMHNVDPAETDLIMHTELKADQALEKAPWGDTFGMLTDKYGIEWMVNISAEKQA